MALKSMTGFGEGTASAGGICVAVEISSVNRKQLDVNIGLPRNLAALDARVQGRVRQEFTRGRISGIVRVEVVEGLSGIVKVDAKLAAQYVEGIRADVRVINLSILNAPWYIKQLRDLPPKVPISFSDDYIDNRLSGESPTAYQTALWSTGPKEVTAAGITWDMPPDYLTNDRQNGLLSVSSIMTAHIMVRPVLLEN